VASLAEIARRSVSQQFCAEEIPAKKTHAKQSAVKKWGCPCLHASHPTCRRANSLPATVAEPVEFVAIYDEVSNTWKWSWKKFERRKACSSWWWMFIEEYIYEEQLEVNISGMSCATVSLLPWAEMNSRKKKVLSGAKSILGSRSVKPPRRKKATREF
jgi:hypothetical protein